MLGAESQDGSGRNHGTGLGFPDLPVLLFCHQTGCREQEGETRRLGPVECRGGWLDLVVSGGHGTVICLSPCSCGLCVPWLPPLSLQVAQCRLEET